MNLKKREEGTEGEESYLSTCCLPSANRTTPMHWVKCQTPCSLSLPVFCFLCYVDNHTNHLYMPDKLSTTKLYHQPHLRVFMSKLPLFRCWQLIKKKKNLNPSRAISTLGFILSLGAISLNLWSRDRSQIISGNFFASLRT